MMGRLQGIIKKEIKDIPSTSGDACTSLFQAKMRYPAVESYYLNFRRMIKFILLKKGVLNLFVENVYCFTF